MLTVRSHLLYVHKNAQIIHWFHYFLGDQGESNHSVVPQWPISLLPQTGATFSFSQLFIRGLPNLHAFYMTLNVRERSLSWHCPSLSTVEFNRSHPMELYGSSSVKQFLAKSSSTDGHSLNLLVCKNRSILQVKNKGKEDVYLSFTCSWVD